MVVVASAKKLITKLMKIKRFLWIDTIPSHQRLQSNKRSNTFNNQSSTPKLFLLLTFNNQCPSLLLTLQLLNNQSRTTSHSIPPWHNLKPTLTTSLSRMAPSCTTSQIQTLMVPPQEMLLHQNLLHPTTDGERERVPIHTSDFLKGIINFNFGLPLPLKANRNLPIPARLEL